jgi:MoaA/NifB/PqqE/SkfB family radical SAM enzyme
MAPHVLQIRPITNCPARCATCTTLIDRSAEDMSLAEIADNVRYFVETHGVDELVFSGAEITTRPDFAAILEVVREAKFSLVTLISSGLAWSEPLARACSGVIDRVVVALTPASAAEWSNPLGRMGKVRRSMSLLASAGVRVQTNTVLLSGAVAVLPEIAAEIEARDIAEPIFLFPFATGGAEAVTRTGVPAWPAIRDDVGRVLTTLEARRPVLKGLPVCALGPLARFGRKTSQRFLVERDRQREQHALIPPFVGMRFDSGCQGCSVRSECDGYWPAHVEAGTVPAPQPLHVAERASFVQLATL